MAIAKIPLRRCCDTLAPSDPLKTGSLQSRSASGADIRDKRRHGGGDGYRSFVWSLINFLALVAVAIINHCLPTRQSK
jgi:hypothetical protein